MASKVFYRLRQKEKPSKGLRRKNVFSVMTITITTTIINITTNNNNGTSTRTTSWDQPTTLPLIQAVEGLKKRTLSGGIWIMIWRWLFILYIWAALWGVFMLMKNLNSFILQSPTNKFFWWITIFTSFQFLLQVGTLPPCVGKRIKHTAF